MKHYIALLIVFLISSTTLFAQLCCVYPPIPTIDNKGNRTQTYPNVTTVNNTIQELTNQVSVTSLEADIRFMQNLGIRDAISAAALQTQNWLIDKFESFGLDVSVHRFVSSSYPAHDTLQAGNVVAIKKGTAFPNQYIIISSHYDSGGYLSTVYPGGPGADDNASGTAAVVECARILSQFETKRSIIFIPFNAEENWLHGSIPFAIKCAQENMNILGVFNLDMLGFYPAEGYGNIKMFAGHTTALNQNLFEFYSQVANLYLPEVPTLHLTNRGGGDAQAFCFNDYPALYIGDIEYESVHPCYHQPCDTIGEFGGVNNMNLVKAYTQATLAAVAELANGWLPPQNFSAVSEIDKVTLSWDTMPETSKYKVYKNDILLTETTSNSYIDNNVVLGEIYAYYVKGIHSESEKESNPSNIDNLIFSSPLTIPYSLDLDGNLEELKYWWYKNWTVKTIGGNKYLYAQKLDFSIIELDWFPIPENLSEISLRIVAINGSNQVPYESRHGFIEVTTDRKTWHKLAKNIDFGINNLQPDTLLVSLNEFIGSPFFQLRIRLGAWGRGKHSTVDDIGRINLYSLAIEFTPVSIKENEKATYLNTLQLFPNPTTGIINIKTESENSYDLAVYDLFGKKVYQENAFRDGILDLSSLPKGAYFIQVSLNKHQMAKKVIVN